MDCATAEDRHRYLQTFIPIVADLDLIDKVLTENGDVILGPEKILELRGWLEEYKAYLKERVEQYGLTINEEVMSTRRRFLDALLPATPQ